MRRYCLGSIYEDEYTEENVKAAVIERMKYFGRKHDNAGYGGNFRRWLFLEDEGDKPYGSFRNGSAMRASSVGWLFDTLEETEHEADSNIARLKSSKVCDSFQDCSEAAFSHIEEEEKNKSSNTKTHT